MRSRVATAILCIIQLFSFHVHAGPILLNQVQQLQNPNGQIISVRLRYLNNTPEAISDSVAGTPIETANRRCAVKRPDVNFPDTTNSLFTAVPSPTTQQKTAVELIAQDDLEGTICDCGEILIAGGGFPKWPFLFLGAIPFFFLQGSEEQTRAATTLTTPITTPISTATPTPTPTPTPPPAPIPEPSSLLLFGSSLVAVAALLRRRRNKESVSRESIHKAEAAEC